ncbi:MAG: S9 family peptidase [Thermoanaerobaculia bacterium]
MRPIAPRILLALLLALPAAGSGLEDRVAALARVGGAWSPSFSPDGSRLAFVSDLSGVPQVWTIPLSGGFPERVTPFEDPVSKVRWSPAGALLAFSVAPGGGMNEQVWVARPDGTGLRLLTPGRRETNRLSGFTRDASRLLLASNERTGSAFDAYLLDPLTLEPAAPTNAPGSHAYTDVSCDGRFAVLSRLAQRGDNDLLLVELETGAELLLTPHERPGSFGGGVFSPDGKTIWLSSNAGRDLAAFARIRLGPNVRPGPVEIVAARDDAELSGFEVDEAGLVAALVWNVAGRSELAFVDLATGRSRPGPALPSEIASGLSFSPDGKKLAMVCSGSTAPMDVWILDRARNTFRPLTRTPHAGIDLSSLVKPTLVRFPARDGLSLSGWLYRPAGASSPGPVVLSFHGGPEAQERPAFRSDYQALVSQGISVLAPNVRGSSGFGKRFVNLDNGPLRKGAVEDIAACVDYVVKAGIADPKRIGIMGGSYGGYMTMAGLTEYPELFAAGANFFGIVNFATFFRHTEPWMAAISNTEYGDPDTQAEMLASLSPIHRLDRVKAPTLVLHGANDTNCPVVEAEQVVEHLKGRNVPVEYVLFPDEGHGWRKLPNRVRSTVEVTRWFVKYLKGDPDPATGRRDAGTRGRT